VVVVVVCAFAVDSTLLSSSSSEDDDDDVAVGFVILARFIGFALSRDPVSLADDADVAFRFFVADSFPLLGLTSSLSLDDDDSASLNVTFSELNILPGISKEHNLGTLGENGPQSRILCYQCVEVRWERIKRSWRSM